MIDLLQSFINLVSLFASITLVIIVPGYILSLWLFPPIRLDIQERIFITLASSIAISSLLAASILLIGNQLNDVIFTICLLVFCIIATGGFLLRLRNSKSNSISSGDEPNYYLLPYRRTIMGILGLLAISSIAVLQSFQPRNQNFFTQNDFYSPVELTEFYISPEYVEMIFESLINHPGSLEIPLEIVNHSQHVENYHIDVVYLEEIIWQQSGITIASGQTWKGTSNIHVRNLPDAKPVDILLYKEKEKVPISRLRLWP